MDVLKRQISTATLCHKFAQNELVNATETVRKIKTRLSDLRQEHRRETEKYAAGLTAAKAYLLGTSICPVLLNNMQADIANKHEKLSAIDNQVTDVLQELKHKSAQLAKAKKQAELMQARHQNSTDALKAHISGLEERAIAELAQRTRRA